MYRKLVKAYLIAQIAFSIILIVFGFSYGIMCFISSRPVSAIGFLVIGYVCGYQLCFKSSLGDYREFTDKNE